jgi:CRP-like cAMP-binding protein
MQPELKAELRNYILRSIDEGFIDEFAGKLDKVEMPLAEILHNPLQKIEYVYFPETSVISIVTLLENGNGVESGIIGREGISGTSVIMGEDYSPRESTVQLGGEGWRMRTNDFRHFFEKNDSFRRLVLHYIYAFIAQISQNAVCLCYHIIEQRLARWLLMFDDRTDFKELQLTQEFIAQMLGVHRPSVSISAKKLQDQGLISYNRGTMVILDRKGLEEFTCECYDTINMALSISRNPLM